MADRRQIKVFIASPGDLAEERRAFRDTIQNLNKGFGDGAGLEFIPLGWEDTLATTGRRTQSVINADVDSCEVFVLTLHRRWGQPAPDAHPYSSYTEEEFHRGLDRWKKSGTPEVFVFFKRVDAASEADPGPQLSHVLEFRRQLEQTREVRYRTFDDVRGFCDEIDRHLRAYARGELPPAGQRDTVILPLQTLKIIEQAKAEAAKEAMRAETEKRKADAAAAREVELALALAQEAARAAADGRISDARQHFAIVTQGTPDIRILRAAAHFYDRVSDPAEAERVLQRWLAISGPDAKTAESAEAWGRLSAVLRHRGDYKAAEAMVQKSLNVYQTLRMSAACRVLTRT